MSLPRSVATCQRNDAGSRVQYDQLRRPQAEEACEMAWQAEELLSSQR